MRLIDAEELDEKAVQFPNTSVWVPIEVVWDTPTIDAVPVVRCRNCLYWQSGENEYEEWEYCKMHETGMGPHSFCSYGERKDGE